MASVRKRLGSSAETNYERIEKSLSVVLDAELEKATQCPHCKRTHLVKWPDMGARTRAIQLWLDQGFGKSKEAESEVSTPRSVDELEALAMPARNAWLRSLEGGSNGSNGVSSEHYEGLEAATTTESGGATRAPDTGTPT